jgi:DNA repair protein RadC
MKKLDPTRTETTHEDDAPSAARGEATGPAFSSAAPRRRRAARHVFGVRLVRDTAAAMPDGYDARVQLRTPSDVFAFMEPFARAEEAETFWIIALDAQHRARRGSPIVVTCGILNSSLVHPREVFRAAIVANAYAVLLVHNHPSGDPTPSRDDLLVTKQIVAAGRLVGIPVHDHVVVAGARYVRLAERGGP